jgi:hypothetical protein
LPSPLSGSSTRSAPSKPSGGAKGISGGKRR